MRFIHIAPFALAAALAAGCDATGSDPAGPPAALDVVSGDLQTAEAGTELPNPLVVEVTDDKGRPIRAQVVNWVVTAGGGSVFAGTALTDRDGRAQERWTLGTAAGDTQTVQARAVDPTTGEARVFATFRAIATPAAAAKVAPLDSASRTGSPGEPVDSLAVLVTDAYGNPVAGEAVSFAASGGGSVSPTSATTGADGVARASWTLGTIVGAEQTATATVGGLPAATFTARVELSGTLSITGGNGQTAPAGSTLPDSLEVRFTTAGGTPIQGATIVWSAGSGGSVTPPTSTTGADGYARTMWRLGASAGSQSATARVQGTTPYVAFTATGQAGNPHEIEVISISGGYEIPRGTAITIRVQVRDASDEGIAGVTVAWANTCGGPMTPTSSVTDAGGYATTSWLIEDTCGYPYTGTATVAGIPPAPFELNNIVPGPATRVGIGPDRTVSVAKDTVFFRPRVYEENGTLIQPYEGCRYVCYEMIWSSSDSTVARPLAGYSDHVDTDVGEMVFYPEAAGTAIIVAKARYGTYADSMVLTVTADGAVRRATLSRPASPASTAAGSRAPRAARAEPRRR